jgi:hypothetical protein
MPSLRAKGWALTTGMGTAVIGVAVALLLTGDSEKNVLTFYQEHLREPLFLGFLTVAAFLFCSAAPAVPVATIYCALSDRRADDARWERGDTVRHRQERRCRDGQSAVSNAGKGQSQHRSTLNAVAGDTFRPNDP